MNINKNLTAPSFKLLARAVALAVATAAASAAFAQTTPTKADDDAQPRPKDDAVRLGTITIVGQGDKLGAGQILKEDAVKARSTVTQAATEKDRATGNPYQALSLLPGINTFNHDATGLFGGGLTMRGFNSDQIGFTINGVPVNDSGNYAVFPQEYVDQENACTQTVTQGNPDVDSPHVGATGGSVGITSCDPTNTRRFRVSQTIGGLSLSRTFLRADSGRFADDRAKVFVSYSQTQADKWKGLGKAKRDHVDAAFSFDISPDSRILGSVMYNTAVNNNIATLSLAQLAVGGYYYDYLNTFTPGHLSPVKGTAQRESVSAFPNRYYKLSTNPFENLIASLSGSFKLANNLQLKVQPYLWTGFGTGGTQHNTLQENRFLNVATGKITAAVDLNGDGDTLDTVIVATSSVTKTTRPGITTELNYALGSHSLKAGVWYERAEHIQTAPAVSVDANGNSADVWLREGRIKRPDGSDYQGRDWKTISPSYQLYASDAWSVMNDRGVVQLGLRAPHITRKFTNTASEGATSQTSFNYEKSFSDVLPQAGFRFNVDRTQQVFLNVGKNFRAPPNFAFAPTGTNIVFSNSGFPTLVGKLEAETSVTTDFGYRYQGSAFIISASGFNVDFKNRQANAFDPEAGRSIYTNAGGVTNRGIELELGTRPIAGFTAYASITSQKSTVKDDFKVSISAPTTNPPPTTPPAPTVLALPTAGKQFPATPQVLAGFSLQYSQGPFYARIKAKHTGKQFVTLMNDEEAPAYTTADFDAGYRLPAMSFMKNGQIRFNVSNIGNTKYRSGGSGAITNAKPVVTRSGTTYSVLGTPLYYLGAPRLVTVSISADF
jgi:iron complex outermembrane recepter protein